MAHTHGSHAVDDRTRRLLALLIAPVLVATVIGLILLWPSGDGGESFDLGTPDDLVGARVVGLEEVTCEGTDPAADIACVVPTVVLLDGTDEGEEIDLVEQSTAGGSLPFGVGDTIVLGYYADSPPGFEYSFADVERRNPLYVLMALFVVAVIALGRMKGLRALLGIAIGLGVLAVFVLPAMLEGSDVVLVALVGASAVAVSAIYLSHGLNAASTTALIGTFAALGIVAVLSWLFTEAAHFSGLADEEAAFLQIATDRVDVGALVLAGIMIGTLGVLDDVTVTQVSAVWELRRANPGSTFRDLYGAGIRIGRDHIASTVNTLVLAYAGASLPLLLLFTQSQQGFVDVLNGEVVAIEIVRTLVGSIGIVASVPITTALAAVVVAGERVRPATDPRAFRARGEQAFWERDQA